MLFEGFFEKTLFHFKPSESIFERILFSCYPFSYFKESIEKSVGIEARGGGGVDLPPRGYSRQVQGGGQEEGRQGSHTPG